MKHWFPSGHIEESARRRWGPEAGEGDVREGVRGRKGRGEGEKNKKG